MTKPREPRTLEKALIRVADVLPRGFDDIAEITGRQPWLGRAWADPDKREQIPLRDALLLDTACARAGGGAPIAEFYFARLDEAGALAPLPGDALARHAASVVRECSEAGAALFEASQADAAPAQRAAAQREVHEALAALERALVGLMGRDAFDLSDLRDIARPGVPARAPP